MTRLVFDVAAGVTVLFGALMVLARNPVRSVLSLVVAFFSLAVCYVMLLAPLVAAIQVIVYAGAILVLFLFVLMLLNVGAEARERPGRPVQTILGGLTIFVFTALLLGTLRGSAARIPAAAAADAVALESPRRLAQTLFSDYLLHFEAVSVLLLAALVGAFVLARREPRP